MIKKVGIFITIIFGVGLTLLFLPKSCIKINSFDFCIKTPYFLAVEIVGKEKYKLGLFSKPRNANEDYMAVIVSLGRLFGSANLSVYPYTQTQEVKSAIILSKGFEEEKCNIEFEKIELSRCFRKDISSQIILVNDVMLHSTNVEILDAIKLLK